MPTYESRCVACEHQFERFQRMSDEPVKVCEKCGEPVNRLLFPVAIQFKGNGFYSTDYACRGARGTGGSQSSEPAPTADADGGSGKGKSDASTAPASAPASTPATTGTVAKGD